MPASLTLVVVAAFHWLFMLLVRAVAVPVFHAGVGPSVWRVITSEAFDSYAFPQHPFGANPPFYT